MNERNPSPSTPVVIIFSAFLAAFAFIATQLVIKGMDMPPNDLFNVITGLASILFACAFTIFIIRKRDGRASFGKLFVASLISAFAMSLMVVAFYFINFNWLEKTPAPEGYAQAVMLQYNAFGMIFSSLLAIIFRKE